MFIEPGIFLTYLLRYPYALYLACLAKSLVTNSICILVNSLELQELIGVLAKLFRLCISSWQIKVAKVFEEVVHVGVEASDTLYFIPLDKALVLFIRAVLVSVVSRTDIGVVEVALALYGAVLFTAVHHVIILNYVFEQSRVNVII